MRRRIHKSLNRPRLPDEQSNLDTPAAGRSITGHRIRQKRCSTTPARASTHHGLDLRRKHRSDAKSQWSKPFPSTGRGNARGTAIGQASRMFNLTSQLNLEPHHSLVKERFFHSIALRLLSRPSSTSYSSAERHDWLFTNHAVSNRLIVGCLHRQLPRCSLALNSRRASRPC